MRCNDFVLLVARMQKFAKKKTPALKQCTSSPSLKTKTQLIKTIYPKIWHIQNIWRKLFVSNQVKRVYTYGIRPYGGFIEVLS